MHDQPAASIRSGATWQGAALRRAAFRRAAFRRAAFRLGRRGMETAICAVLMLGAPGLSAWAQNEPAATAAAPAAADAATPADYTTEQLDALLAPIALYPDQLLTQILMASAYPLEIVSAYRWQQLPANKDLTGDALATALEAQSWDPSVKSLVPFPQVLSTMNDKLDWVQQLGYAVENQESDVMDSVQRLRKQAQEAGQLKSNEQQVVSTENQAIIIAPAQPNVVYVPAYNPTVVYGAWPYPAYPPVYLPPPPGYALASGIAFGVGVAVTASLWGWARPGWGYGGGYNNINVNVNRYNNINRNRTQIHNSNWRANRPAGGVNRPGRNRPPGGPVGRPGRGGGLPANAIGRPKVKVPGNITRPPGGIGGNRPGAGNRPGGGNGAGGGNRPGGGGINKPGGGINKPGGGGVNKPGGGINKPGGGGVNKPGGGNRPAAGGGNRPKPGGGGRPGGGKPGAFSGMNQGKAASQMGNRGAQSRAGGGGRPGGGGGGRGGGGGGGRMGGGGGRHK